MTRITLIFDATNGTPQAIFECLRPMLEEDGRGLTGIELTQASPEVADSLVSLIVEYQHYLESTTVELFHTASDPKDL